MSLWKVSHVTLKSISHKEKAVLSFTKFLSMNLVRLASNGLSVFQFSISIKYFNLQVKEAGSCLAIRWKLKNIVNHCAACSYVPTPTFITIVPFTSSLLFLKFFK